MSFPKNRANKQPTRSRGKPSAVRRSFREETAQSQTEDSRPVRPPLRKRPNGRGRSPFRVRPSNEPFKETKSEDVREDRTDGDAELSGGVRLVKYLAACGVASRRKAADFVFDGRVSINGQVVKDVSYSVNVGTDRVAVDGKFLRTSQPGLLLFYKPRHIISTLSDPHGRRNISSYLTSRYRSYVPVGRLDFESEGLMILTNDGDFCNVLLHPRYELDRTYEVHSPAFVSDNQLKRLEEGIELEDGFAQAEIKLQHRTHERSIVLVTIREGRNRQVRRMFEAIGADVVELKRIAHGPFNLGSMKPGEVKRLSEREFSRIREKVMRESDSSSDKKSVGSRHGKSKRR